MVAQCMASRPKAMDLSCGFQLAMESISSGMRSRVRRLFSISLSKSRRRISEIFMGRPRAMGLLSDSGCETRDAINCESLGGGLLADGVAAGFSGDELCGVGECLLRVGVELGEAAGVGLAADGGVVEVATGEDLGGEENGDGALRVVDGDAADGVAVVVAGVEVLCVAEAGVDLVGAAGVEGLVEGDEDDGVLAALDEGRGVVEEPGVVGGVFDEEVDVRGGEDGEQRGPLAAVGEDGGGDVKGAGLDDLLGGDRLLGGCGESCKCEGQGSEGGTAVHP